MGCIKLNVDAALLQSSARIAVIARNEDGMIIKAWAKSVLTCKPLLAEAHAIQWAIILAKAENWSKIMIESDSKVCIEALVLEQSCEWSISVLCINVKLLALEFSFCEFCWVNCKANMVAHTLAKLAIATSTPILYFPKNLLALLEDAWFRDFICIAVPV